MNHSNRKHSLKLVKVALAIGGDEPSSQAGGHSSSGSGGGGANSNSNGQTGLEGDKSRTREVMMRQWLKICRKSSRC